MTAGKITMLVVGLLLALIGFGVAAAGGGLLWAHNSERVADGYVTSPTWTLATEAYALTAEDVELVAPTRDDWLWYRNFDVRIDVESRTGNPVFVGVARKADVDRYLAGVHHTEVTRLGTAWEDVTYREVAGLTEPARPGDQGFWVAQAEGEAPQLDWQTQPGTWAVVVMNADAHPGLEVGARAAVTADFLLPLGVVLLGGGIVLLAAGAVLIVAAVAGASAPVTAGSAVAAPAAGPYPLALRGRLDTPLSRWLWLVKWVLLIPHAVVLLFLWIAFAVLTVVAGFAILLTGRYPRGIFDFNVGVMRWTWRAVYYGYSALGTDRYPPFTLEATDYPATLDVAYPKQLSRGLVLVKWWLLAIPHYLIVGLLVGGGLGWAFQDERWGFLMLGSGTGILGILVFVAGLVLLVRARYPQGLFDIVMGLNRWVYRVLAYAALMTDVYPPFRLDLGGEEPEPAPDPPTTPPSAPEQAELVAT